MNRNPSFHTIYLLLAAIIGTSAPAIRAAPILSGTVTQIDSTYTYSYALNNTGGPGPITHLDILISSAPYQPFTLTQPVGPHTEHFLQHRRPALQRGRTVLGVVRSRRFTSRPSAQRLLFYRC